MPSAEIVTIGTELLLGEIIDTNSRYLARTLRDHGIDLYRTTTVGDNIERIAQALREAAARCDIIITTGGLGPTVDDPTRDAVALAVGRPVEFIPELWDQIIERFQRYGRAPTENNRKQAQIPAGATPIPNPVGTAPAFACQSEDGALIISLPGVPREMEYLLHNAVLPMLREKFNLNSVIVARVLHSSGVGESVIDEWVADLETLANPTVGLAAHSGQVDLRITAKAETVEAARAMIDPVQQTIMERMGDSIYGVDDETLGGVVAQLLAARGLELVVVEKNATEAVASRLQEGGLPQAISTQCAAAECEQTLKTHLDGRARCVGLGIFTERLPEQTRMFIEMILPEKTIRFERFHGGAPQLGPTWAANTAFDALRRELMSSSESAVAR